MRFPFLSLLSLVVFSPPGAAQERANDPFAPPKKVAARSYLVTLSEYRSVGELASDADEAAIIAHVTGEGGELVETIRLSAVEDIESTVQFGKRVNVVTGKQARGPMESFVTQSMEVGTLLKVQVTRSGKTPRVKVTYEASRLREDETDRMNWEIRNATLSATVPLSLDGPKLLGATTAGETAFFLLAVREID